MKILVVDDHPLILAALGQLLPRGERSLSVIGAADRDEAYAMLAAHPDCALVLLDLALPGTRGLELLGAMRRDFPRLPIAVLSATHDRATVDAALAAGARGYIAKTASGRHLVHAVERLPDGRSCPRPDLARTTAPPVPGAALAPDALGLTRAAVGRTAAGRLCWEEEQWKTTLTLIFQQSATLRFYTWKSSRSMELCL